MEAESIMLRGITFLLGFSLLLSGKVASLEAQEASGQRVLLDQYCIACHNGRMQAGNLELDSADVDDVAADPALWEKVVRKLRAGAMPPLPRPRPTQESYLGFIDWLETELNAVGSISPNPGRTEAMHRLNRAEYHNVIRDLLALDVEVAELLPADDGSYGFDNIAGVLGVSPTLLERYLAAARKISRLAVGRSVSSPTTETFRVANDLSQDDWVEGMPFGTRGGATFRHNFPQDGDYTVRVVLARNTGDALATFDVPHTLEVSLDDRVTQAYTVGEPPPTTAGTGWPAAASASRRAWTDSIAPPQVPLRVATSGSRT